MSLFPKKLIFHWFILIYLLHIFGLLDCTGQVTVSVQVEDHVMQVPLIHWKSSHPLSNSQNKIVITSMKKQRQMDKNKLIKHKHNRQDISFLRNKCKSVGRVAVNLPFSQQFFSQCLKLWCCKLLSSDLKLCATIKMRDSFCYTVQ